MRVVSSFSTVVGLLAALMVAAPNLRASAQVPSRTTPKTRVIVLGTAAGPLPRKDRAQSAHAVVVNGATYLFDAGDGVARRLIQAGITPMGLTAVFLTHGHADHTAGLATLLSVAWDFHRKRPLDVSGPPGTAAIVAGAIRYMSVNAAIRWDEGRKAPLGQVFVGHDVGTGVVYRDDNIKVRAMENTHFHFTAQSPAYGRYKSYSYRVETPDRVIVFTGDTGPFPGLAQLAQDADVLVTEISSAAEVQKGLKKRGVWDAMNPEQQAAFLKHLAEEHLSADDIATLATGAHVKAVVLVHLPTSSIPNDDYARLVDKVKAHFAGTVVAAKDLMSF
jgi:ribonuclease BN (tRNA processing enzyme)